MSRISSIPGSSPPPEAAASCSSETANGFAAVFAAVIGKENDNGSDPGTSPVAREEKKEESPASDPNVATPNPAHGMAILVASSLAVADRKENQAVVGPAPPGRSGDGNGNKTAAGALSGPVSPASVGAAQTMSADDVAAKQSVLPIPDSSGRPENTQPPELRTAAKAADNPGAGITRKSLSTVTAPPDGQQPALADSERVSGTVRSPENLTASHEAALRPSGQRENEAGTVVPDGQRRNNDKIADSLADGRKQSSGRSSVVSGRPRRESILADAAFRLTPGKRAETPDLPAAEIIETGANAGGTTETGNSPLTVRAEESGTAARLLPDADIFRQVAESIRFAPRKDGGEVSIHLKPESLGRMSLNLELTDGTLTAKFYVENSIVRETLAARLPELRTNLQEQGIACEEAFVFLQQENASANPHRHSGRRPSRQQYRLNPKAIGQMKAAGVTIPGAALLNFMV